MKKYFKFLIIALVVAVVVPQIVFASWWNPMSWGWLNRFFHFQQTEQKQEQKQEQDQKNSVACTMDAKECPDGSYVGRTGPNCEFEECSEMKTDEIVKTKEQSCINSGGKVIMQNCNCPDNVTPADFYNHCNMALNTCFCDPSLGIKRQLKSCDCGPNKCWNGTECSTIEKEKNK